jgi:hypothetical protein
VRDDWPDCPEWMEKHLSGFCLIGNETPLLRWEPMKMGTYIEAIRVLQWYHTEVSNKENDAKGEPTAEKYLVFLGMRLAVEECIQRLRAANDKAIDDYAKDMGQK